MITVSSIRHIPGKAGVGARFDFDNLKGEKWYDPRIFYNRLLIRVPGARRAVVAGQELADLAFDQAVDPGAFYANGKQMRSSAESYDDAKAERLWQLSEQLTGS